jgi:hypothetical protein
MLAISLVSARPAKSAVGRQPLSAGNRRKVLPSMTALKHRGLRSGGDAWCADSLCNTGDRGIGAGAAAFTRGK